MLWVSEQIPVTFETQSKIDRLLNNARQTWINILAIHIDQVHANCKLVNAIKFFI